MSENYPDGDRLTGDEEHAARRLQSLATSAGRMAEINRLNRRITELEAERDRLEKIADALLAHCDREGGECSECGKIVCDHNDPMHFHHDGCPSCWSAEDWQEEDRQ